MDSRTVLTRVALDLHAAKAGSLVAPSTAVRSGLLQRKCACGGTPGPTGECEACRRKRLQRKSANQAESQNSSEVPPIVHKVLRSPGQPLDPATRSFMESGFSHDFSHVRVHTDAKASESAHAVNALAYTLGPNVVFASGQYSPARVSGKQLLAHELAHVIQQGASRESLTSNLRLSSADGPSEREADAVADRVMAGQRVALPTPRSAAGLQRKVRNDVLPQFQAGANACLVHLHGEEKTALAVGEEIRNRRCVNFMHLDTTKRFVDFDFTAGGFNFAGQADPNRLFTPAGRSGPEAIFETHPNPSKPGVEKVDPKTIRAQAEAELQDFADNKLIPNLQKCRSGNPNPLPVLALHNNEGLDPAKFKPSASTARSPNPATGDPRRRNDFFFTTQPADFDALKGAHNVVLQENPIQPKNDDGSLSVFLADQRYINVEKEGRNKDKLAGKTGGFQSHDKIYLQNYAMATEALDLFGVPDMPCGASPDFDRRTRSMFNRRLGQSGRLPTRVATDKPSLDREDIPDPLPKGCRFFKDQPALDRRADEWRTLLDRIPLVDMIHWALGGPDFTPKEPLAEFRAQQKCLINAMSASLKANGLSLPTGNLVKSEQRSFADQKRIWSGKFTSTSGKFDRISEFARKKCPALPATDVQWDPAKPDHKACWGTLTDEEKQKEILMASSGPGISRHHAGVDFDFGQTDKDLEPQAWTGSGRFADAYSWLARNASAYGFIQPFDRKGGYGTGYMTERWHWSYFPVAQAVLEFIMDHEAEVDAKLQELWGDGKGGIKPEFSFVAKNWQKYVFNVEQEGVF
jgi:hypothetical protein